MKHLQERRATAEQVRPHGRGAPLRCRVPECPGAVVGEECLCRQCWPKLSWRLRWGAGWRVPVQPSPGWLRDALAELGSPVDSVGKGEALSPEEKRFRPVALKILQTLEYARPDYVKCTGGQHPCPWVSCPSHLKLTVTEGGTLQDNHPGVDIDEMEFTCAEDFIRAHPDGASASVVGRQLGVKKGRVGQIEREFKRRLRPALEA